MLLSRWYYKYRYTYNIILNKCPRSIGWDQGVFIMCLHSLHMMPWGIPRHNLPWCLKAFPWHHFLVYWTAQSWIYSLLRTKTATQNPSINYIIWTCCPFLKCIQCIKSLEQKSFVYDDKQRLSQSLRVAKSNGGRRHDNCDVTMVAGKGLKQLQQ